MTTSLILSRPLKINISVYRGDSGSFQINLTDIDGSPIDISLATWDADIRATPDSVDVITSFEIVPVDGEPSKVNVILSAESSKLLNTSCVYDIEMTIDGDVKTLMNGSINIKQDVSRAP